MNLVQFHCFEWVGSGAEIADDHKRRQPEVPLPPLVTREWLNKPRSLRVATYQAVDETVGWLAGRVRQHAPNGLGGDRTEYETSLLRYDRERLELHRDVVTGMWLVGGRALRLAVVVETAS